MSLHVDALSFDCHDPKVLADFWTKAIGYRLEDIDEEGAEIVPSPGAEGWPILFDVVPEGKAVKNRLHLDLRASTSMAEEVARLQSLGATVQDRVDVEGSFWTVMLDPEGNELCVLRGPEDGWSPE